MLQLDKIAKKLEAMFNGTDPEISSLTRPVDETFVVETTGFYIDHIYDNQPNPKHNFVPVFISTVGGDYDPVPNIQRSSTNLAIRFYFPVKRKEFFFKFQDYLVELFVGKIHDYDGTKALSNISVAQYGEIQELDFRQFKDWVQQTYKDLPIEENEVYLEATINLYLSTMADGYLFGNSVEFELSFTYNSTEYKATLDWTSAGTGVSNSPIAQQLIDDATYKFTKNVVNITNRSQSILAYVKIKYVWDSVQEKYIIPATDKESTFWAKLIELYNSGNLDDGITALSLKKTYNFASPITATYSSIVLSMNENIARGEPLSFTIAFGDKL